MEDKQLPRMDFGTVFNDTFTFIFHNIKRLIPPLMLVTFPVTVIVTALDYLLEEYIAQSNYASFMMTVNNLTSENHPVPDVDVMPLNVTSYVIVGMIILNTSFAVAVYQRMTVGALCGIKMSGWRGIKEGLARFLPVLFTVLLMIVLSLAYFLVAFLLCTIFDDARMALGEHLSILGIDDLGNRLTIALFYVFIGFYAWLVIVKVPIILSITVIEGVCFFKAIKKSWYLTRGSGWSISGILLFVCIAGVLASLPIILLQKQNVPIFFLVYSVIIHSIWMVVISIMSSYVYLGCKRKVEGATPADILKFYGECENPDDSDSFATGENTL